jgi:hypothetical protein
VLDAVFEAQGKGCAPGILGVCVGGDRVSAFEASKRQLLRPLVDVNPVPELAELEERVLREATSSASDRWASAARRPCSRQDRRPRSPARLLLRDHLVHVLGRRKAGVSIDEGGGERHG